MIKITPTLASHMIAVYKAMQENSYKQEDHIAYTGKLSELVNELGISMTYYSTIFRALYQGEYAALSDRGGRNKPSTVILIREPTLAELQGLTVEQSSPILSLMKRVEAVESSLGGVSVIQALKQIESRLNALEDTEPKERKTSGKTKK